MTAICYMLCAGKGYLWPCKYWGGVGKQDGSTAQVKEGWYYRGCGESETGPQLLSDQLPL